MILVPDANALIHLAKAQLLQEALGSAKVHVGDTIYREAVETGIEEGHADAYLLDRFIERECERKRSPPEEAIQDLSAELGGSGEAEALLLSRDTDEACTIVTSDKRAHRRIDARGSDVVRTDMLLFHRFRRGDLDRHDLYESLLSLRQANGTTDGRIAFFLTRLEEET